MGFVRFQFSLLEYEYSNWRNLSREKLKKIISKQNQLLAIAIREARESSPYTINELAANAGVPFSSYCRWEYGKAEPGAAHLALVVKALDAHAQPIIKFLSGETQRPMSTGSSARSTEQKTDAAVHEGKSAEHGSKLAGEGRSNMLRIEAIQWQGEAILKEGRETNEKLVELIGLIKKLVGEPPAIRQKQLERAK